MGKHLTIQAIINGNGENWKFPQLESLKLQGLINVDAGLLNNVNEGLKDLSLTSWYAETLTLTANFAQLESLHILDMTEMNDADLSCLLKNNENLKILSLERVGRMKGVGIKANLSKL